MVMFSHILPNQLGHTLVSEGIQLRFVHMAGKGAYGIVYLAWDLSTPENAPKFYAVKVTLKYDARTEFATLQKQETIYHSAMSGHPNVTTLHRVIEEEHYVYFVLDYHEGGDLFGAIIDRKSFHHNDAAVKLAYVQLLDAVQACHDAGISHRDLKPENILCSQRDSRLFLSDFGLATRTGLSDSYGCGSSHYMSPECVGSIQASIPYSTRRSDIWALGVILINILTGHNPWQIASVSRDEGFERYCRNGVVFLTSILQISREAAQLISRALDPNPRTRISISELRQAVLDIRTFFPEENVPDYIRLGDESFRASLQQPTAEHNDDQEEEVDDDEIIIDVPFGMPHTAATDTFSSIPLNSSSSIAGSTFVNQFPSSSSSSLDTDETIPPSTPVFPASELSMVVPTVSLVADNEHPDPTGHVELSIVDVSQDEAERNPPKLHKNVRRLMGAVKRVALWA